MTGGKRPGRHATDTAGWTAAAPPVGFLLRKFYQKNQAIWQALCPDKQMTSVQSAALSVLQRGGPCTLTTLGRAAAMDPATTRGVVDRLRRRGMIVLQNDPVDRRKVIVQLAPAAQAFFDAMATAMPRIEETTLAPLNPAERVALAYLLQKVTATEAEPPSTPGAIPGAIPGATPGATPGEGQAP